MQNAISRVFAKKNFLLAFTRLLPLGKFRKFFTEFSVASNKIQSNYQEKLL